MQDDWRFCCVSQNGELAKTRFVFHVFDSSSLYPFQESKKQEITIFLCLFVNTKDVKWVYICIRTIWIAASLTCLTATHRIWDNYLCVFFSISSTIKSFQNEVIENKTEKTLLQVVSAKASQPQIRVARSNALALSNTFEVEAEISRRRAKT